MVTLRADASKAVDAVPTSTAIVARVAGTFINVNIAHPSCVSWLTGAFIAIDPVDALAIITWIAGTVIQVDLTIGPCCSFEAQAVVAIVPVLTDPTILAWLTLALVDVDVTAAASIARLTVTCESGEAVPAGPIVARIRVALIDVRLTV